MSLFSGSSFFFNFQEHFLFLFCICVGILASDDPQSHPVIKKGEVPQLVLVGFKQKEDAVRALEALEEVSVAPASRSKV